MMNLSAINQASVALFSVHKKKLFSSIHALLQIMADKCVKVENCFKVKMILQNKISLRRAFKALFYRLFSFVGAYELEINLFFACFLVF